MAPSLLNRLVRTVVPAPNEAARAARHARRTIDAWRELLSNRGEVSGAAVAHEALHAYRDLPAVARPAFYTQLATAFTPDQAALRVVCEAYIADPSPTHLAQLQAIAEPPLQKLCQRLNQTPGGTAALIDVRRHVLAGLAEHPEWHVIDAVLGRLFHSWFNRGFLTLQRIDWHTPAFVLEKLIEYEAVHEISGWRDLRRRLQSDRRCFAFFHPALPDEPLIFIEVALVKGISNAVQPLLALDAPVAIAEKADTAVFYSITNCQPGLRGVSFGNLLIKQVAQNSARNFRALKPFQRCRRYPASPRGWRVTQKISNRRKHWTPSTPSPRPIGTGIPRSPNR